MRYLRDRNERKLESEAICSGCTFSVSEKVQLATEKV